MTLLNYLCHYLVEWMGCMLHINVSPFPCLDIQTPKAAAPCGNGNGFPVWGISLNSPSFCVHLQASKVGGGNAGLKEQGPGLCGLKIDLAQLLPKPMEPRWGELGGGKPRLQLGMSPAERQVRPFHLQMCHPVSAMPGRPFGYSSCSAARRRRWRARRTKWWLGCGHEVFLPLV